MVEENKLMREGPGGVPYVVKLKNPGTDGIEDFLKVLGDMNSNGFPDMKGKTDDEKKKIEKEHFAKVFSNITPEGRKSLKNLVQLTLRKTYPKMTEEDDAWGMENFMTIFPMVIEMCSPKDRESVKKTELVDRIKQLQS